MSSAFPNKRFVMIFPFVTSILIFASIAGIIGNSVFLADTSSSFNINSLETGELSDKKITFPTDFEKPELRIVLTNTDFSDIVNGNGDGLDITIYLADSSLPDEITTQSQLLSSEYYDNAIFDEAENVFESDTFFLSSNPEALYIIFANEGASSISFRVDVVRTSTPNFGASNTTHILGIIFSAILTAVFIAISVYLWLEIFEKVPVRFMTNSLEDRLDALQTRALTWEVVVFLLATVFMILGYSEILLGLGSDNIFLGGFAYVLVYYTFNKRSKLEESILSILTLEKRMSLSELANRVAEEKKVVKKTLLDAIMYSNFPADYDFKENLVIYNPSGVNQPQVLVEEQDPVRESSFHVASTEVESRVIEEEGENLSRPMPKCAYCDAEAIKVNAQFCHSCGASMSSAK